MFPGDLRKVFVSANPLSWLLSAVAIYVFLAPNVDFTSRLTWHDGQRLGQLALLGLVMVMMLVVPGLAGRVLATWLDLSSLIRWALTCAFGLGVLSSWLAPQPRWAFLEWGMMLLLMVLALAVAAGRRELGEKLEPVLLLLLFATALAYAVKTVVIYVSMLLIGPDYGLGFNVRELYTGFSNIRFFGHVQTMLLPFLVLPVMWWGTTLARRAMLWSIPALWWMLLIGSGGRGSWVALLVGALVAWWFGGRSGSRWMRWQTGALLAGAAAYLLFVILLPDWLARPSSFMHRVNDIVSLRGRDELWAIAIELITHHPWLGIGPMHYAQHLSVLASHPHNAILQIMVEWGIPAALLVTAVWAAGGLAWALHVRRLCSSGVADRHALVLVALLAAITGAAVQAMVDGIIVMPVSQILLALLCGWALGCYLDAATNRGRVIPSFPASLVFRGVVLLALAAMVWGVLPEIGRLEARTEAHLLTQPDGPNPKLLPRFWVQGWIDK